MSAYKKCECGQMMAWLKTNDNKSIPVNVETLSETDRYELNHGLKVIFDRSRHVSHFATCLNSNKFRKPKQEPIKSFFEKD